MKAKKWTEKDDKKLTQILNKSFNKSILKWEKVGMYKIPTFKNTNLIVNNSTQGETLEQKIERVVNNKEPIKDGAPLIYTDRKEGIRASTNIKTDRFEIAVEATDKIAKSYKARREERHNKSKKDGETEPIQGKVNTEKPSN